MMMRISIQFQPLLPLWLAISSAVTAQQAEDVVAASYQCDFMGTPCPEIFLFNGECESYLFDEVLNPCFDSDCLDCDPCKAYQANCQGCTAAGCVWCPGDAYCSSQPLGPSFWDKYASSSSCGLEAEWVTTCTTDPTNYFNDPLFEAQEWVYEAMNVQPVWEQGITGSGVIVRVNDPHGVDTTIAELAPNFDMESSCEEYMPPELVDPTDGSPIILPHGTQVSSIALAVANNSICAAGVAPEATLSACLGPNVLHDSDPARFFTDGFNKNIHVSINSWGFDACKAVPLGQSNNRRRRDRRRNRILRRDRHNRHQRNRNLQTLPCPFERETTDNPCYHPACALFNETICLQYTAQYCQQYSGIELGGCAEFLDEFLSCEYNVLSPEGRDAITQGITQGRNGLGIIYLFASGNENAVGEVVNMEGWLNTRFTITVGAVGKNGYVASYSTPGAALFVSGPGGDSEFLANHITAYPSVPGGGGPTCVDASIGTSFATPAVAGVIALLLQAKPDLSWRDVQGILALTSQRVYPGDESWTTNGAGISHSYKFGFGVVDALGAVEASRVWQVWGAEEQIIKDSGPSNLPIADENAYISSGLIITADDATSTATASTMTVESVVVYLLLNHSSRGDLEITLESPDGTESILMPGDRPENTLSQDRMKLMTVRNWGENPVGTWKLKLLDKNKDDNPQCTDLPFNPFVEELGGELSCRFIEEFFPSNVTDCLDDIAVLDEEYYEDTSLTDFATLTSNNNTFMTACCRCGGGIPSSSVVNTLISWQLIVYGHNTPATGANDAVLSVPCDDSCDPDLEFCGTDDNCHALNCEETYLFGPVGLTGYDPDTPEPLECYDYDGSVRNVNAIVHGCSAVLPFGVELPPDVVPFFFNQVCNATLSRGRLFECYDVKADTSFTDYIRIVNTTTPPACDNGASLMYHYTQTRRREIGGNKTQRANPRSSLGFNESMARTSIISLLKDGEDFCYPSGALACPQEFLFNNLCEDCVGDCFDCDRCAEFSYTSCDSCTEAGCFWCPGDATCQSQPRGQLFWAKYEGRKKSSCPVDAFWVPQGECGRSEGSAYGDPLYDSMQWSYKLLYVEDVWSSGITGKGVHVRVNDDGVAADHPEFTPNFDVENSCEEYLPLVPEKDTHGTACASIIGASTNDVCAVGIANGATISACVVPLGALDAEEAEIFLTGLDTVDVSSNSWGPIICTSPYIPLDRKLQEECPFLEDNFDSPCAICETEGYTSQNCEDAVSLYCLDHYEDDPIPCAEYLDFFVTLCRYHMLEPEQHNTFVKMIQEGRGGKGIVFVFAAGNDFTVGVNTNNDGYVNSRFTIAVAAVGKDGLHASYSTIGAAVFVSGPGGDTESVSNNVVAHPLGGCHDITVGTSFAAPAISGVIALMLEKNPELTWRDVQGILASTSYMTDPDDDSWNTNSAGYSHSYKYGFGIANATAAVDAAATWATLPPEKQGEGSSGVVNIPIPDDGESSITSTVEVSIAESNFFVESVVAYVKLAHPSRGDLRITLISPSGVESVLAQGGRTEYEQLAANEEWKLMTLRSWGEKPNGVWTLQIQDEAPGRLVDCVDLADWQAVLEGDLYNCEDFELFEVTDCIATMPPEMAAVTVDNYTADEACCACGGGKNLTNLQPALISWRLMVYGNDDGTPEVQPTETELEVNGNGSSTSSGAAGEDTTPVSSTTATNSSNTSSTTGNETADDSKSGAMASRLFIALATATCSSLLLLESWL